MPLVMMCGTPCSGKSTRVAELQEYLARERPETPVILIEDDHSTMDRNAMYSSELAEKESRGRLRSEVQKMLTKDKVVILDAPNYIKGFRYELFCLCKGCKTTQCVVHCEIGMEMAWSWNLQRRSSDQYERPVFEALFARFEEPDSRNRWDSPLVAMLPEDDASFFVGRVHAALFDRKPPPPNQSTQCQPLSSTNFLYDIDRTTQQVVAAVLRAQQDFGPGAGEITIESSDIKLRLTRTYAPMELARLRRQFLIYIKTRPVEDGRKVASMFVQYLNGGHMRDS